MTHDINLISNDESVVMWCNTCRLELFSRQETSLLEANTVALDHYREDFPVLQEPEPQWAMDINEKTHEWILFCDDVEKGRDTLTPKGHDRLVHRFMLEDIWPVLRSELDFSRAHTECSTYSCIIDKPVECPYLEENT